MLTTEHNLAPGNAGYVFWYDILAPAFLIVMYSPRADRTEPHLRRHKCEMAGSNPAASSPAP
jgi:hypothetical protein